MIKIAIYEFDRVGIYLYFKGKTFVNVTIDMIIENGRVQNEFYTCSTYNYAIKENARIGIFNIKSEEMQGIGTSDDLSEYLKF